ncbi:MAG: hypothetical protein JHC84_12660 [Solirubrobacteraceae bacterium]|nr:hypothetical protein [Solirubrobacteraceae bacterium]
MPLRKQGPALAVTAVAVLSAAAMPATAQAGLFSSLFKPKTTSTATAPATTVSGTTAATVSTAPAPSSEQVTSTAVPAPAACQELPTAKSFQGVDGDVSDYSVAPGGNFESGTAGWTLSRGARIVSGNETLGVSGGSKSLQMPLGSSAISPEFCVDESHPHFRFVYKVDNMSLAGFLAHVVYRDASGKITGVELVSSKALSLTPTRWQASPKSPLATIIPLNPTTKSTTVQLKLTSLSPTDFVNDTVSGIIGQNPLVDSVTAIGGAGTNLVGSITGLFGNTLNIGVTVDSVMVDPYRRR